MRRSCLARCSAPFAAIPGNHDRRALIRETFPRSRLWNDPTAHSIRCAASEDSDIFLIHSTVAGAPHGELDAPTLAWLDGSLGASTTRPAFLFLHHPPFDTGIVYTDAVRLRNADALAAVLRRHPTRAAGRGRACSSRSANRVCRHLSQYLSGRRAGRHSRIRTTLAGSFQIDPPAFHLHAWLPGPRLEARLLTLCRSGSFRGP